MADDPCKDKEELLKGIDGVQKEVERLKGEAKEVLRALKLKVPVQSILDKLIPIPDG